MPVDAPSRFRPHKRGQGRAGAFRFLGAAKQFNHLEK
jgi:hypothetical protein